MKKSISSAIKIAAGYSIIIISGCSHQSEAPKKIAEKYDIPLEQAERCYSEFRQNTETVLDWLKENESWFFGFFSEDCDDLISQLPPFKTYDNLLAAKTNEWSAESPEYKKFLLDKERKISEAKQAEEDRKRQERLRRMRSGTPVKAEDFGEKWPFTVNKGYLDCTGGYAVFRVNMIEYALSGAAESRGHYPIDSIWRDNPNIPGTKINIGDMIDLACPR